MKSFHSQSGIYIGLKDLKASGESKRQENGTKGQMSKLRMPSWSLSSRQGRGLWAESRIAVRLTEQVSIRGHSNTVIIVLNMLMTHPVHHRRGAGKLLIQQGTSFADEAGLPCYLEGSPAGYRLYLSIGFEDVETLDMDMSKFGGEGSHPHYIMIRPARVD